MWRYGMESQWECDRVQRNTMESEGQRWDTKENKGKYDRKPNTAWIWPVPKTQQDNATTFEWTRSVRTVYWDVSYKANPWSRDHQVPSIPSSDLVWVHSSFATHSRLRRWHHVNGAALMQSHLNRDLNYAQEGPTWTELFSIHIWSESKIHTLTCWTFRVCVFGQKIGV